MAENNYRSIEEHLSLGVCGTLDGIKTHLAMISKKELFCLMFEPVMKNADTCEQVAQKMWAIKKGRCLQAHKIARPG